MDEWEFFSKKIVIFWKFSIFDSKFLENYITDFQTETSFELSRASALKWCIFSCLRWIKFSSSLVGQNFLAFFCSKKNHQTRYSRPPSLKGPNLWWSKNIGLINFKWLWYFFEKKAIFLASVKIRSNLATLIEIVFESFLGNCVMQNEIHLLGADLISQPLACQKM